jgi:tRNA dimethylallyltransferase
MRGVPHHLIDSIAIQDTYSAGDFAVDAARLIQEIAKRGKLPILVGGTHFYFDALLRGLPHDTPIDYQLRGDLEKCSTEELYARLQEKDVQRSSTIDPHNRRRLIRALEIIEHKGIVPPRVLTMNSRYACDWIIIDPPREELRKNIDSRLASAFARGLIEEVQRVNALVGRARLNEFGLEYRIVGEYLYGERSEDSLIPALSAKLWHYARRQKAWLRKLREEELIQAIPLPLDRN